MVFLIAAAVLVAILLLAILIFLPPLLGPWFAERSGLAEFARAEQNRQIIVEQAAADKQAAILRAEAELETSKIRAQAIAVVGEVAKAYPEYRLQEFIGAYAVALETGTIDQIIYVPTEANIPILEAGGGLNR